MAFLAFRNQDGVLKLFKSNERYPFTVMPLHSRAILSANTAARCGQRCSRARWFKKECSDAEPENVLSSRVGQATHLTVCAVLRRLKTQSKATVIYLVLRERPVFPRFAQHCPGAQNPPGEKSPHLFYLIRYYTWQ